jgi:hypothetical protein
VVLAIIPQLIFGGSTVPRSEMELPAKVLSEMMISKPVLELLGDITNLDRRVYLQAVFTASMGEFGSFDIRVETPFDNAFKINPLWRWLVLAGWAGGLSIAVWFVQSLKGRSR